MLLTIGLKQKLRFSYISIIAVAALGASYSFYLIQKSKSYVRYRDQISNILLHLKDARISEKNFILHDRKEVDFLEDGQSEILQNHLQSISMVFHQIDTITAVLKDGDVMLHTQLTMLKSGIREYEKDFETLKNLYYKRGFKDHGLEGSMRGNVHDLQKCISPEEQVYAFSLRRHEKDFMLRKDISYYEKLKQTSEDFKKYVFGSRAAHMTAEYKSSTTQIIDKYVQKFGQIVDLEKEIGLTENEGISGKLNESAQSLVPVSNDLFELVDHKSSKLQGEASMVLISSMLLTIAIGLFVSRRLDKVFTYPILSLNRVIQDEIEGKPRSNALEAIKNKDEIGTLTENFKLMMAKMDTQLKEISEKNDILEISSEKDRKRKWVAEGVSSLIDMIKNSQEEISEFGYKIISGMVRYIGANQGGIFLIDDLTNAKKMNLVASYAYDRRKYHEKEILRGEGLIGGAWEEKETVVISNLPQGYISITSGLGHALPDKLIIVPIKNEEEVLGVVEIASFKAFEAHEIELIQKTSDRLGTLFVSMKIQERTNELLQTSQIQAEELKTQEEELRQNLEEMQATQESYSRREKELNTTIKSLKEEVSMLKNASHFIGKDSNLIVRRVVR
jgi:putative methionine-R-sulfoxide reductase with GAF domain